jgi:membrane-bound lytic murein transglycosylase B
LRGLAIALVLTATPASSTAAADQNGNGQGLAGRIVSAQNTMTSATARTLRLRASTPPSVPIDRLRYDLQLADSQYAYRDAARAEQVVVYALAADSTLEQDVLHRLPPDRQAGLPQAADGVRSLWRLAGITEFSLARVRRTKRFADAEPVESLLRYYRAAPARTGIDWTYLAAINYIESTFGRSSHPSGAGAEGPMQFLPSTWQEYGGGGDVMSPHDSIEAAATFLRRNGAPSDYGKALLHYNRDSDYVASVQAFAAAMRAEPSWLNRLYCWSTYG